MPNEISEKKMLIVNPPKAIREYISNALKRAGNAIAKKEIPIKANAIRLFNTLQKRKEAPVEELKR